MITMIMMMMMFASTIIIIERQSNPVASSRQKRKMMKTKRKDNALTDVTLKRTHVANEGNAKIATRQIGTQWIRYRCALTDPVRIFLMDDLLDHFSRLPG